MKRWLLLSLVVACADTDAPPDALAACQVELGGNFVESSMTSCPTFAAGVGATQGDTLLEFTVASQALGADFMISLDLGQAPTPGAYSSRTTSLWNATGVKTVPPGGACLFLAGNTATPTGYFTLELAAIDDATAHGELALTLFVLPRAEDDGAQTDCGPGTTEDLQLRF